MRQYPHTQKGEATRDFLFFVAILFVLGVLWVLSGGPSQNSGGLLGGQRLGFSPIERNGERGTQEERYEEIRERYGDARDFGETSPHWGLVTINSSRGMKETRVQEEYLILEVSRNLKEPLTVTNWRIQSMVSNKSVSIPEATKISTSGTVNIEQPLVVSPRDVLYVATGHSPTGYSFKVNKCSGYFEQFQNFTPRLEKSCPLPLDELDFAESDPIRFGGDCLDYIEDIPRCHMPIDALPIGFNNSCALFITEKINYNTCVENHRNDTDFFEPEWRVFLRQNEELWDTRDIVRLLDEEGKVVDVLSY